MEIKDKNKSNYDDDDFILDDTLSNDNFELDDFIDRLAWVKSDDIESINKLQEQYLSFSPKEEEYIRKNAVRNGVNSVWEVYEEDFSQEAKKQLEAKINTFLDRFSALKEQKKSEVSDTLKEDDKIIYRHYYDEHNQKSQEELKSMLSDSAYFAYVEHNGVRTIFNIADNGDLGVTLNIPYLNLEGELHTNVKTIYCQENSLSKIVAPDAKRVYCNNNKIKEIIAPNASYIDCRRNLLEKIELESAIEIKCNNNPSLKELNAPKCEEIYCENTLLTEANMQVTPGCFIDGVKQLEEVIQIQKAKAMEVMEATQTQKLNELWEKFRYKDIEFPEANDNLQFSAIEELGILALLKAYSSNPEILELLEKTSIEANALKEDVDFIHYTPDIMDFDMFIEGDGAVVYDDKAYQKAVEEAEKFKEEFYKRQDKVEAVKEQYPQEMKILEEFFNAPEDWVRERKKFFSELIHNKELLESLTSTHNENLEQNSGRIFKNEEHIDENEKIILDFLKRHPDKGVSFYKIEDDNSIFESRILIFDDTQKSFNLNSEQIQRVYNTNDLTDLSNLKKLFSDDGIGVISYHIQEIATIIGLNQIREVNKEQILAGQKIQDIALDAHLMIIGKLKADDLEKFKKEYNSLPREQQEEVQKKAIKETIDYMEEPFDRVMSKEERKKVEDDGKKLLDSITEPKKNVLEVTPKHIMDELLIVEDELDTLICNEQYLTELYAPNTENIVCKSNGTLLIIDAPNATTIECRDCEMLEKINAPNCVKLICEGSDFLKKEDIEVAYNCEIEGLKEQRGIKI